MVEDNESDNINMMSNFHELMTIDGKPYVNASESICIKNRCWFIVIMSGTIDPYGCDIV